MIERRARRATGRGLRVLLPLLLLSPAFADEAPFPARASGPAPAASTAPLLPTLPVSTAPSAPADPRDAGLSAPAPAEASDGTLPTSPDAPPASLEGGGDPVAGEGRTAESLLETESLLLIAPSDTASLGPLSIGTPDAGLLVNPLPMPEGPLWTIRNPLETWATQETIDFVVAAVEAVEARFPGSPRIVIGDISRPDGGRLNRHKSHQAGRDVDIGFYYASGEAFDFRAVQARGRRAATRERSLTAQLDLPRTWALVRAFVTETDVDRIFVDRSIIGVLYRHARDEAGESPEWLDDVFGRGERKGIVQHERRHKDHLHVRFFNQVAQEKGRVAYPLLVEAGVVGPPVVRHRAARGETLGHIASRYGTSVAAVKAANGLRSSRLRAGRSYLVPVRRVKRDDTPFVVPPRRLPPSLSTQAVISPAPPTDPEPKEPPALATGGQN